jgi:uncharacterized repeat protein (TIGR03803 family)
MYFLSAYAWAASGEKVLYSFAGGTNGAFPIASGSLALDGKGNVYGTTESGGNPNCDCGEVFELTRTSGGWTKTILYEFSEDGDGFQPDSGLVFDKAGNLYGTTVQGGTSFNCGTVYRLSPNSNGTWTENILYNFKTEGSGDGCAPISGVILDAAGNIYGTTPGHGEYGFGTVYKLTNSGGVWSETILHNFNFGTSDGQGPLGLAMDAAGNLYGTTTSGGQSGVGIVFELSQSGGTWTENILYDFQGGPADGAFPESGLTFDEAGNLYGTTLYGGSGTVCPPGTCGTVYRLKRTQGTWVEELLYSFQGGNDGSFPFAGVTILGHKLYGTTGFGGDGPCVQNGSVGCGTLYVLEELNGKVVERTIQLDGSDGYLPEANLVADKKGVLFGTTLDGGSSTECDTGGCGVVFSVAP